MNYWLLLIKRWAAASPSTTARREPIPATHSIRVTPLFYAISMKLEIDLDDIFRDENGDPEESAQDSIRRQVLARLTTEYRERLFRRFDDELAAIMQAQVQEAIKLRMPSLVDDIMNTEFIPVSNFGQRSSPTTFRAEIVKAIGSELVYKPKSYSSEENTFTRAVKGVVSEQTKAIEKALRAEIDESFKRDAIAFAVAKIQERLGLSKK